MADAEHAVERPALETLSDLACESRSSSTPSTAASLGRALFFFHAKVTSQLSWLLVFAAPRLLLLGSPSYKEIYDRFYDNEIL